MPSKADSQAMAEQFCSAFNAGAPAAALNAYAEDACVVSPDGVVAVGHDQIRAYWTRPAEIRCDLKAAVDEVPPLRKTSSAASCHHWAEKARKQTPIGRGGEWKWKLAAGSWHTTSQDASVPETCQSWPVVVRRACEFRTRWSARDYRRV
jgi:hypothetical protein